MKIAKRKCIAVLSLLFLNGCALDSVPYLFQLASNQVSLLSKRQPIEEALKREDSGLTPQLRDRLKSIPDIRAFARRIGLSPGGAYTQYAPVDLKVYVVTAAEQTRLKRYEWWWPIVGSVPYKGFFSKEDAQQEIEKFRDRSKDTHVRTVRAYSTLGWFDDPIVPAMLRGSRASFVGLLLHESVHATFFRKDNTAFNEEAAVLIERAGTLMYLREKLGTDPKEIKDYREAIQKGEHFLGIIDAVYAELSRLYASEASDQEKLARREEIFQKTLSAHPQIERRLRAEKKETGLPVAFNNAYILAYRLYFENRNRMWGLYGRIGEDLPRMVSLLKQAAKAEGDPFEALERMVKKEAGTS